MPEAPSQRRFLIAMMLFVIVVINYLDRSNISIVGPELSRTLNLTPVKLGIVLSGFGWTYVALQIPCGWLVDRVHPRYLLWLHPGPVVAGDPVAGAGHRLRGPVASPPGGGRI